jgi:hypothetical protein
MTKVLVKVDIQVEKGRSAQVSREFHVQGDLHDEAEVPFASNGNPGECTKVAGYGKNVQFLLIRPVVEPGKYESLDLTYKIQYLQDEGKEGETEAISLKEPHFYMGAGAVSAIAADIAKIVFVNRQEASDEDKKAGKKVIVVEILAGRDASST